MVTGPVPLPGAEQDALGPVFIWNVYPRSSSDGSVAAGVTEHEEDARLYVETILGDRPDSTAWGVVVGLGGKTDICRRTVSGGFRWAPMLAAD